MKEVNFLKKGFYFSIILLLTLRLDVSGKKIVLWYDAPADATQKDGSHIWESDSEWVKAMPLGNGSLGIMVYGDVTQERIQLNEETMWSGSVQDSDNPEANKSLEKIKQLLFDGQYKEANKLAEKTQVCTGKGTGKGKGADIPFGCFQPLGDLWIDFTNKLPYENYRRELNLENAKATIQYSQGGVDYKREMFISNPDQVMVVKLSASKRKQLSFSCRLTRPERFKTYTKDGQLVMSGALSDGKGGEGLQYMAMLKVLPVNGTVSYTDSTLTVSDADEVLLLLTASTDYKLDYPHYKGRDFIGLTQTRLAEAEKKSFKALYDTHVKEYANYFSRVSFSLTNTPATIPTDKLVLNAKKGTIDSHLYELMFQYGRYLLISSSRPGSMPANLQGVWTNRIQTPWNGDYHTDINLEMNYWPAEVTNLSELHLPLFDLISSLVEPGMRTARIQYNKKGWIVHPVTNVWGFTAPGEYTKWGLHTGAAAWICQHISEHFRYTGNKEFLNKMYPVLKGAVEFYMDWLSVHPKSGEWVSGPAVSPENTFIAPDGERCYISMGPAHDQQVIMQLFNDFIMVSDSLHINNKFVRQVATMKNQMCGIRIDKKSRIMEWAEDFKEAEPGHRHLSHLFALYPGMQINTIQTPALVKAANQSIEHRIKHGRGSTPWSSSWLISLYARSLQAEAAQEHLNDVLTKELNPNLFTQCSPFQIDANFGVTAGVAEMILQSHIYDDGSYIIQLLPALPKKWKNGEVSGLKARGGFEVSVKWVNGQIVDANIKSLLGSKCSIWYDGNFIGKAIKIKKGDTWSWEMKNAHLKNTSIQ